MKICADVTIRSDALSSMAATTVYCEQRCLHQVWSKTVNKCRSNKGKVCVNQVKNNGVCKAWRATVLCSVEAATISPEQRCLHQAWRSYQTPA